MKVAFFMSKQCGFPFSISVVYAAPILFKFTETKSNLGHGWRGYDIITISPITGQRVRPYFGKPFKI